MKYSERRAIAHELRLSAAYPGLLRKEVARQLKYNLKEIANSVRLSCGSLQAAVGVAQRHATAIDEFVQMLGDKLDPPDGDEPQKLIALAERMEVGMKRAVKSKAAKAAKVDRVMKEYGRGVLKSGSKSGPRVKSPKQAVAIALSEAGASKRKAKKA